MFWLFFASLHGCVVEIQSTGFSTCKDALQVLTLYSGRMALWGPQGKPCQVSKVDHHSQKQLTSSCALTVCPEVAVLQNDFLAAEILHQRRDPFFPGTFNNLSRHTDIIISVLNLLESFKSSLDITRNALSQEILDLGTPQQILSIQRLIQRAHVRQRRALIRLRMRGIEILCEMAVGWGIKLEVRLAQCREVIEMGRQLGMGVWRQGWSQRIWGAIFELMDASKEIGEARDWVEDVAAKMGISIDVGETLPDEIDEH